MPVSYTAPVAPVLPSPVGLDAEIQRLQLALAAGLPWLAVSYGRATRGGRKHENKSVVFPEVYDGSSEYRDVLPNDNVQAQSFFYPRDPATTGAIEPSPRLGFTQIVDLIVWGNLAKIDPTKAYRYDAELLRDVLQVLTDAGGVLVQRWYTSPEQVFQGFTLDAIQEQCLRHPFAGFRVQLEVSVPDVLCLFPA